MLVVGLTGGAASGKTTVSRFLKEEGAYLIDADQIARALVKPQTPLWSELVRVFGKHILKQDGSLDRKKLSAIVFSDPPQRRLLNELLHPRIKEEIDRLRREIGEKDPEAIVVIDAPLLVETGSYRDMDQVVVVTCTETQQLERLQQRDGSSLERAREILSAQLALEEKIKVADHVIRNENSLEETRRTTKEVFKALKKIVLQEKGCAAR